MVPGARRAREVPGAAHAGKLFEKTDANEARSPTGAEVCSSARPEPTRSSTSTAIEPQGEALLDAAELDAYTAAFERTGFFGPISWYRNADRNREIAPELGQKELDLPVLQVVAAWDAAIPPAAAELTRAKCSDVEVQLIDECGHWTQQEKPAELTRIMVDWLVRRFGEGTA